MRKTPTIVKIASSDLVLRTLKGETHSPSRKYHYSTQGKYTSPLLWMMKNIKHEDDVVSDHPSIGKHENAYYVSPEKFDAHLKAYINSENIGMENAFSKRIKDQVKKKFLGLIPYTKNVSKVKTDTKGMKEYRNSQEFKKEHKALIDFMKKHKNEGFVVGVQ